MGITLILFFGFLVHKVFTQGELIDIALPFVLAIPPIVAAWLHTYFRSMDPFRQYFAGLAVFMSILAVNLDMFITTDLQKDWVHSVNMLLAGFNFTFIALRFRIASLLAVLQVVMFELVLSYREDMEWSDIVYANALFLSVLVVSATAGFMLERSYRRNFLQARSLEEQRAIAENNRQRSDALLLNILPAPVADRLRLNPALIAERFDDVSVLFADLVNFTGQSQNIEPEELVRHLDHIFSRFDAVIEEHQLEKIKTIGDAYMAVAGVPSACADHAQAIARSALGMIVALRDLTWPSGDPVVVRVGIASGPAVAGVIGRKKFAFDLWGDTVNTASRMESSGEPGRIQVTGRTHELLQNAFRFEGPHSLEVKGFGRMETWYLLGEN